MEKKKVLCIGSDNKIYWAFSGEPNQLYKLGRNYEKLDEKVEIEFKRWATSFDV